MSNLVTVIITTHNRKWNMIKKAVMSAYNQTYKNIEILVVNDSPDFEGVQLIKNELLKLGEKVKYIENDKCPGACGSRNIGIQMAKGSVIALLDDDDEWHLDKIELMMSAFDENIGLVYCNFAFINSDNSKSYKKSKSYEGKVFEQLLDVNFIGGCSVPLIKKECFIEVGLFDLALKSCQDLDMWLRISKRYDVAYVDKILVDYFVTDISITSDLSKRIDGIKYFLKKHNSAFNRHKESKRIWQNIVIKSYFETGKIKDGFKEYNLYYSGMDKLTNSVCIIKGLVKCLLNSCKRKK